MKQLLLIALIATCTAACARDNHTSDEEQFLRWRRQISHPRNPHITRRAAEEAGNFPIERVRPDLISVLEVTNDDETVARAAATLGKMVETPLAEDVTALLRAFNRVDEFYARGRIALTLGGFAGKLDAAQSKKVIAALVDWLERKGNAEQYVAEALGQFGPRARAAVPALRALLTHKWEATRAAARTALERIGGKPPKL